MTARIRGRVEALEARAHHDAEPSPALVAAERELIDAVEQAHAVAVAAYGPPSPRQRELTDRLHVRTGELADAGEVDLAVQVLLASGELARDVPPCEHRPSPWYCPCELDQLDALTGERWPELVAAARARGR